MSYWVGHWATRILFYCSTQEKYNTVPNALSTPPDESSTTSRHLPPACATQLPIKLEGEKVLPISSTARRLRPPALVPGCEKKSPNRRHKMQPLLRRKSSDWYNWFLKCPSNQIKSLWSQLLQMVHLDPFASTEPSYKRLQVQEDIGLDKAVRYDRGGLYGRLSPKLQRKCLPVSLYPIWKGLFSWPLHTDTCSISVIFSCHQLQAKYPELKSSWECHCNALKNT